ncbi:MAG TPA: presqualene diphosphate synthase HpnD [Solirubrobacteraceae bacterium]|nr:presqualene diphosphate synthase HpnD [Solirubrobacteraceae bacterium]
MTVTAPPESVVLEGYRACEALTRSEAANFYYGIRLLPAAKRRAMCAVYAFARQVDDIGDGGAAAADKLVHLAAARDDLAGVNANPMRLALADAERRFDLPHDALEDLIAGVEMDVRDTSYETFDELVVYCRRVAGTIGRLCLAIFGSADPAAAQPLADDLGVAMQLTNIIRDIREDLERRRIYLPAEDRRRFGCEDLGAASGADVAPLVSFEVTRAREWFDRGLGLLDLIDGRSAACVSAMTGIYRRILERIAAEPSAVLERRVSLPPWEKTWVAVRSLTGGAR